MKYTLTILFALTIRILTAQFYGGNGAGFVHSNLNGYCSFVSYSPFFGGSSDGSSSAKSGVSCSINTPNPFGGGSADGFAKSRIGTGDCQYVAYSPFFGGFSDGYANEKIDPIPCFIFTPNPFGGGISDGFARSRIGTSDCSYIAYSPFFGGFSDGYANKKIDSIPCLIFTPTPFGGGIADGFSRSHLSGDLACEMVTYSPFFGGIADGYANDKLNPLVCEIITPSPFAGATSDGFARGNLIHADMITCAVLTPLPIELLYWDAVPQEDKVLINWVTASERNNDYFTVERTIDGNEWIEVGQIPGAGNSSHKLYYELYDLNPIIGVQYYKLKQTDFNGDFTYSDVKSVAFYRNKEHYIAVFPNPTSGQFTMEIYGDEISNGTIRIMNVAGQVIEEKTNLFGKSFLFDISSHALGMYLVELEVNSKKQRVKIIKIN